MDRRIILSLLVALATTAFGQRLRVGDAEASGMNANPRLRQLEDYLRQHSHGIEFTQKSDGDGDVWYSWRAEIDAIGKKENKPSVTPEMNKEAMLQTIHIRDSINALVRRQYEDAVDSIRIAFSSVRKDAAESYMYEYHRGSADTISYSVVFRNDAYEDAKFRAEKQRPKEGDNESSDWWFRDDSLDFYFYQGPFGHYSHYRNEPNGLTKEDRKPFDIAAFEAHIHPALEPLMKLQGAALVVISYMGLVYIISGLPGRPLAPTTSSLLNTRQNPSLTDSTHWPTTMLIIIPNNPIPITTSLSSCALIIAMVLFSVMYSTT